MVYLCYNESRIFGDRLSSIGPFRCCPHDEVSMESEELLGLMAAHAPLERLAGALREEQAARLMVAPVLAAARPALGAFIAQTLARVTLLVAPTLEAAARLREDLQVLLGDDVS